MFLEEERWECGASVSLEKGKHLHQVAKKRDGTIDKAQRSGDHNGVCGLWVLHLNLINKHY